MVGTAPCQLGGKTSTVGPLFPSAMVQDTEKINNGPYDKVKKFRKTPNMVIYPFCYRIISEISNAGRRSGAAQKQPQAIKK
jgi:hypothetical protein